MPPPGSVDVAILGGGPAGAVAAHLLAGWGFNVDLLTRPPHARALAESLPPSVGKLLDHTGLRTPIDAAGFLRSTGNTVWWGPVADRAEPFGEGAPGYQVPRDRFDRLLLDQAAGSGARVRRRAVVREVLAPADPGRPATVRFDTGGRARSLDARWVLDCTGRAGLTARQGARQLEPGLRTMALVGVWDRPGVWPVAEASHTLVESYGDGWAWSVPVSMERRYVAVMVDPTVTALHGRGELAAAYRRELGRTARLGPLLAGARLAGRPWARDASPYSSATPGRPGHLLVGDAASFTDPLSSFGVKKAIASAWLAAVVVRTSLEDPGLASAALELYNRRERAIMETLRARSSEFARAAAGSHAGDFWARRADREDGEVSGEPDVGALRQDPAVLAAFAELKGRDQVILRPASGVRREPRPAILADRVVLREHLLLSGFPDGLRWLRNIDLVHLLDLARTTGDVPQLFEGCRRQTPEGSLPDFLGALSVLIAQGALEFA